MRDHRSYVRKPWRLRKQWSRMANFFQCFYPSGDRLIFKNAVCLTIGNFTSSKKGTTNTTLKAFIVFSLKQRVVYSCFAFTINSRLYSFSSLIPIFIIIPIFFNSETLLFEHFRKLGSLKLTSIKKKLNTKN